ncbi:STM4015 family protein [Nocardiopsis algeriensis]|uniref:Leucine rich repeat (LRR) protein n=1 Tax=Nocardiopsis algeriensis TaxID=1478215 RepID=A0A841IN34_9ACTN|nr:STM4015 family protein [Nocardiopsis algeriensis]MBB6118135.1 hypothetical protein [Nocardiopsis algeriensis]
MITEHLTEFAGLPVVEFPAEGTEEGLSDEARSRLEAAIADPGSVAWRLRTTYGERFSEYFSRFLSEVDTGQVGALVIGCWDEEIYETPPVVPRDLLIEHAAAFPALRSLFFGDVVMEEAEVSWIQQTDLAPLAAAFPELAELAVRGSGDPEMAQDELRLHVPSHPSLRSLTVQGGGLPGHLSREIASSGLPALERLELWLGVENYRGDTAPEDLAPVLSGEAFPRLRHLGLRNAEHTDRWVPELVRAPLLERLEVLDLSLGTLTDEGARSLLDRIDAFAHLERLDLHHHYLSDETAERVRAAFTEAGVGIDLSDRQENHGSADDPLYYPSVTE